MNEYFRIYDEYNKNILNFIDEIIDEKIKFKFLIYNNELKFLLIKIILLTESDDISNISDRIDITTSNISDIFSENLDLILNLEIINEPISIAIEEQFYKKMMLKNEITEHYKLRISYNSFMDIFMNLTNTDGHMIRDKLKVFMNIKNK